MKYDGYSISDLLDMSVQESLLILKSEAKMAGIIETLCEVGLGYLKWGQSVKTLSGGEGQRIRLAKELSKPSKTIRSICSTNQQQAFIRQTSSSSIPY